MFTIFELVMDFVICPLVEIFALYKGNVGLWIADTAAFLGSVIFGIIAGLFFYAGIWPAGLLFCLPAIALFLLHCRNSSRNTRSVRERRSASVDVSRDVQAARDSQSESLRNKASDIRSNLNDKM